MITYSTFLGKGRTERRKVGAMYTVLYYYSVHVISSHHVLAIHFMQNSTSNANLQI